MIHLTVDEMMDFVSINTLNNESLIPAKKVSAHIMNCDMCRKRIAAFQTVYDEIVRIGKSGELSNIIKEVASKEGHADTVEKKQPEKYM